MTFEEYTERVDVLNKQLSIELKKLAREYAFSNNTVKVGDIIENSRTKIIVEKILFAPGTPLYVFMRGLHSQRKTNLLNELVGLCEFTNPISSFQRNYR